MKDFIYSAQPLIDFTFLVTVRDTFSIHIIGKPNKYRNAIQLLMIMATNRSLIIPLSFQLTDKRSLPSNQLLVAVVLNEYIENLLNL